MHKFMFLAQAEAVPLGLRFHFQPLSSKFSWTHNLTAMVVPSVGFKCLKCGPSTDVLVPHVIFR